MNFIGILCKLAEVYIKDVSVRIIEVLFHTVQEYANSENWHGATPPVAFYLVFF